MSDSSPTRSDTSSRSRPPLVLLLDQTFSSTRLATAITCDDWTIELHGSHFAGDAHDHEWIPACAERRWLIITCDKNQQRWRADGGLPRQAIVQSRARILFLGAGTHPLAHYAEAIAKARHAILRFCNQNRVGPALGRIHNDGRVEQMYLDRKGETARERTLRKYGR